LSFPGRRPTVIPPSREQPSAAAEKHPLIPSDAPTEFTG
jgi:hypothetical protein